MSVGLAPHRLLIAILPLALLAVAAPPAVAADHVQHSRVPVDQTITFPAGPEAPCFAVAVGTPIVIRNTGEFHRTEFVAGPNAGNIHLHGRLATTFTVPSTGATGQAPQMINFIAGRHTTLNTTVVHMTGTGADGTPLKATFHFHGVVQNGAIHLNIARVNCVKG
jgi:hypothetical protein